MTRVTACQANSGDRVRLPARQSASTDRVKHLPQRVQPMDGDAVTEIDVIQCLARGDPD